MARLLKPFKLRYISDDEWNNYSDDQREKLIQGIQTAPTRKATDGAAAPQPALGVMNPNASTTVLSDLRNWADDVDGIPAERIRNCVIFQLDVKKDKFYQMNLTEGYIRRKARKLHEDTPPNWQPPEKNPLITEKKIDAETTITIITRENLTEEERILVRNRCGVTSYTIPFLAKKSCPRCHGRGQYNIAMFPGHPLYGRAEATVSPCECVLE
jgi:hypothetical protein